jgi:hypothetical protein
VSSIYDSPRHPRAPTPPPEDDLEDRVRALEDHRIALTGLDGTNGKFGQMRKDVDGHGGLLKWIAGAVAGSVITAAAAIYGAGQKDGADAREQQYQREAIEELRVQMRELRGYRAPSWPTTTGDDR